jgi:hypothetical protein
MGNIFGVPTGWTLSKDSLDIFEKFFPSDSVAVTAYKNSKNQPVTKKKVNLNTS